MVDGWTSTVLGDVADVIGGGTPSTKVSKYWGGDIPWVTPTEVVAHDGGVIRETKRKLTIAGLRSSSATLLPEHAVLLTSRATIGAVALAGVPLATNQGFASLVARSSVLPEYLLYWAQYSKAEFTSRASGSTFPEISRGKVRSIPIELPPLEEQRRIIDLMRALDEDISRAQTLDGGLQQLGDAVADSLWGSASPAGPVVSITAPGSSFADGDWIESKDQSPAGIRLLQLADIGVDRFLDRSRRYVTQETFNRLHCHSVLPGDILISRMADPIGRACLIPDTGTDMISAVDCTRVRVDASRHAADYWLALFASPKWFEACAAASGGSTRQRITRKKLEAIEVPLPPLSIQRPVADTWRALREYRVTVARQLKALADLRKAVLEQLLSKAHEIPPSYDRLLEDAS
ncbi:MAG: restriction endonuclease subunit S [Candidatus Dormibacteria bacterium]